MDAPPRVRAPQAVLFACGLNSVRSPMAASLLQQMFPHALYVKSAGVRKGELDPFAVAVMAELGQDISGHKPITFEELDDWEGLNFDLIITLSPEAHHKALELTHTLAADVEYWPTPDPTTTEGSASKVLSTTITAPLPGKRQTASAAPAKSPRAVAIAHAVALTPSDRATMWMSSGSPPATSCTARTALCAKSFMGAPS